MTEDDKGPWTIKAMPSIARDLATRRAKQTGQNVGDWLAMAVENQVELERRATVILPGQTGQTSQAITPHDPTPYSLDMASLAAAITAVTATAQAAIETPGLRGLSSDLAGLLRDQVRLARGLPLLRRHSKLE